MLGRSFDRQSRRRISDTVREFESRDRSSRLRRGQKSTIPGQIVQAGVVQTAIIRDSHGPVRLSNFNGDFLGTDEVTVYNGWARTLWQNALVYFGIGSLRGEVPTNRVAVWTNSPQVFVGYTTSVAFEADPTIEVGSIQEVDGFAVVLPTTVNVQNFFEWDVPEIGTPIMFREAPGGFIAINVGCHGV